MQTKARRIPFNVKMTETVIKLVTARTRERRNTPVNRPLEVPLSAARIHFGDGVDVDRAEEEMTDSGWWGRGAFEMAADKLVSKAHRGALVCCGTQCGWA